MYDFASLRKEIGGREIAWHAEQRRLAGVTIDCPPESPIEIGTPNGSRRWVLECRDRLRVVWVVRHYQVGNDPPRGCTFFHGDRCIVEVSGFTVGYSAGAFRQLLLDELNFQLTERDIERLAYDGSDLLVPEPRVVTIRKKEGRRPARVTVQPFPSHP